MLNEMYIANPRMTGENRLSARTLLIPAQKRGVTYKNFFESDRVQLLNGTWKFSYRDGDTEETFFAPDVEDAAWDDLPVPSMWQYQGYGTCLYPNVRYAFPYDPPYVHGPNPVGLYRKRFEARKAADGRAILRFGGVDNAYFVWLNGHYVGFSKGSRIAAEFDVTDVLRDGDNLLAVKVYTYSDASYLEAQDMLLASGIFRDVMLVYTRASTLWDTVVLPDSAGFTVKYTCTARGSSAQMRFTLCDGDGISVAEADAPMSESGEVFLPLQNAVEWNAEQPYLYTLYAEISESGGATEVYTQRVGISQSEIRGDSLLLNGKPITLKGVNRHDNNPRSGRAVTAEQIERELREIKANGLNAIRCSHYTNQPVFYELCSELGIYVMDEADLESHGAECAGERGIMNKDPNWYDAFFDRVSRMYALNKNYPCVHIWSLGNECGEGENEQKCADWLGARDIKKPVRGDGNPHVEGDTFRQVNYMSVHSRLEPTVADGSGPIIIVEYGHGMGNSPGGLEDIWNWIYEHEHCCGGYVWEYKNHGFYTEGRNGRARYLYGGDFPDYFHMGNFSLDGFHTSDGTPKPVWHELGEIFAPVYVRWEEDGVRVKNTNDFIPLEGVTLRWSIRANGETMRSGDVSLDGLAARNWTKVAFSMQTDGLYGCITADCEFYCNGVKIAHKQKLLADIPAQAEPSVPFYHTVTASDTDVIVTGEDFVVEVRKGLLAKLVKDGRSLLDTPMALNCWRAYIDNECGGFGAYIGGAMEGALVHSMVFGCYEVAVANDSHCVTLTARGKYLPVSHNWGFNTLIEYRVTAGGMVDIGISMDPYGDAPKLLTRVGVCFRLAEEYTHCDWLGRGPVDNYPDRKANAPIGRYTADVETMNFQYDVPQETGNRGDCRELTVWGGDTALRVEGKFSFSFHDFSQEALHRARHADELDKSSEKYLYIDHLQRGLGSKSCGPDPEPEYEIPMKPFQWSFRIGGDHISR